ncbi:MAG: discoidin domain-containing protein [Polyangiaceae bacterium]
MTRSNNSSLTRGPLFVALSLLVAGCGGSEGGRSGWGASPPPDLMALVGSSAPSASAVASVVFTATAPRPPCADAKVTAATFSGCTILKPTRVTATGGVGTVALATDGDACTLWNANDFAPQSLTIDLGAVSSVDGVALVPAMTPDGNVEHTIEFSDDGTRFEVGHRIQAPMGDLQLVELRFPKRERARFIRFGSSKSPSWIAWREISLLRCGS